MVPDRSAYTTVCLMATVLDLMNDHESYTYPTFFATFFGTLYPRMV